MPPGLVPEWDNPERFFGQRRRRPSQPGRRFLDGIDHPLANDESPSPTCSCLYRLWSYFPTGASTWPPALRAGSGWLGRGCGWSSSPTNGSRYRQYLDHSSET